MADIEWHATVTYQTKGLGKLRRRLDEDGIPGGVFSIQTNADTGHVTMSADATAATLAEATAAAIASTAPAAAKLRLGDPIAVTVERWVDGPGRVSLAPLGLLSTGEVAQLLDVSRQRAHQLAKTDPAFPPPVDHTPAGGVWDRAAIESYAATRRRAPGRPRKAQAG